MGTTIRREPVNFDIPDAPNYKFLNITNFRGLDISSNPFELATNTASDCLNVYVDETNTLTTRPRIEKKVNTPLAGEHIGTYNLHNGYLLHYLQNGVGQMALLIDTVLQPVTGAIPTSKCEYFEQENDIYLLDGQRYMVIHDNVLTDVEGYIPNTAVIDFLNGSIESDEKLNLLTDLYTEKFQWEEPYLPTLSDTDSLVEQPVIWLDKTQLFIGAGFDENTVMCQIYSDGSFCARKDKTITYYYSDDGFETLKSIEVFKGASWREYVYVFAKEAKIFSVLNIVGMGPYQTNDAEGYRFADGEWTSFRVYPSLGENEAFVGWDYSKDGRHLLFVKKLASGIASVEWGSFTGSWDSDNPDDISVDMNAVQEFSMDAEEGVMSALINASYVCAFNGDADVCGLIGLNSGVLYQANKQTLKLVKVNDTSYGDLDVLDYTPDGTRIILTWSGLWGAYITNFAWDEVVNNEWVNRPTEAAPAFGIEDVQPKASIKSSSELFVGWCMAWSDKGSSYKDIHYLGDIFNPAFNGSSKGVLGIVLPRSEFAEVFVDFQNIIFCKGDAIHFYVRQRPDNSFFSITRRLTEKHDQYETWSTRRLALLRTRLFTRFNNEYWFAQDGIYYRSKNNNPRHFPITERITLGDSNEPITGFNLANDTTLLVYKSDRLYVIQPYTSPFNTTEYTITESKNTVGNTAIGAPIVTTLTEIPLQINNDGIYGLSQLQNVSAVERIADLMSESINEKWLKEDDVVISNAKTLNRLYWTYIILPYTDFTKIYLLDNRTNSWYYWELPIVIEDAFVKDNVTEFVGKAGVIYYLTSEDVINKAFLPLLVTEYYDYGRKLIPWYWQSQILHLGTMNYSKRLVNTTFILTDTDTQDGYGLQYSFKVFRKLASSTPEKEISDELNLVRSTTKKTNISKFGFVQLKLSNITEESPGTDPEKAYRNNKLRLVGLGLKYVLLEGLIR